MSRWMINCKDFARLMSERMDRPLSFRDRIVIRLHLLVCPPCQHIQTHFDAMRQACRWMPGNHRDDESDACRLPEEARSKIKAALKKHCV
jgi:hypothetical protein